jgi:sec-independent protein translocase protein TatA
MGLDNPSHIAILVVILLLVFGARRLPEIGRSLGSGIREFKGAITGESEKAQTPPSAHIAAAGTPASDAGSADAATAIATEQPEHAGTPTS